MVALKAEILRLRAEVEKWKRGFELMSKSDEAECDGRVHFQEQLAELREAVAKCFECEDFQGGRAAWEQLREMIGGEDGD